jgi:xanthine dehydrogenase accessory factor
MIELLPEINEWIAAGEEVAVATVVRVLGSAPRPVGARMIVSSAGRMAGSVSGGCVETTVYEVMMDVLAGAPPHLLHFGITEDMIWDVGLACGGTIDVFVQKLDPALVDAFRDLLKTGGPFALAVMVSGDQESGNWELGNWGIGNWALITGEGQAPPALGLSLLTPHSSLLTSYAQEMLATRTESATIYEIAPGIDLFVEPFLPPPVLLIIGGVHIAIPLTRYAKELGFYVVVADPRARFANRDRFPEADEVLVEWPDEALSHLSVDHATYIVLLTHDPKIDEPTLAAALKTEAAYIGAIGSRNTHAARFERMQKWGITPEQLARVYGPIGLDLGGRTPAETALSIIAEVVAVKNGRTGGSLRGAGNRQG